MRTSGFVELAQRDTRLYDRQLVVDVDVEDRIHLAKRDENATLAGHACPGKAGARTACGDGCPELSRDPDDVGDLGRGVGEDDDIGCVPVRAQRLVVPVVLGDVGAAQYPRGAEQRREPVDSAVHGAAAMRR